MNDDQRAALNLMFGLDLPTTGVKTATVKNAQDQARLKTLARTFKALGDQSPEFAVGPLTKIKAELATWDKTPPTDELPGGPGNAINAFWLIQEVDRELASLKATAVAKVDAGATALQAKVDAVPPLPAPATAEAKKTRAAAINKLLTAGEPEVVRLQAILTQFTGTSTGLTAVATALAALKAEFKTLRPESTPGAVLHPVPDAARPALGTADADTARLGTLLQTTEGRMATNAKPVLADVEAANTIIEAKIDRTTAEAAMKAHKTWDKVKEHYRGLPKDAGTTFMSMMWWFRRREVDGLMSELQKEWDFAWGSVGSANPESDYDVTVREHGRKTDGDKTVKRDDFELVEDFNRLLSAKPWAGGAPPGILFDTNLYAEAVVEDAAVPSDEAPEATAARKNMGAMKEQGQDVGALMKLRRYMDWDEFEDYKDKMLAGIADADARKVAEKQFDEADSLFFIARADQLTQAGVVVAGATDTPEGQKAILAAAAKLEHDDPAKAMDANNKLYVAKMKEVRVLEKKYDAESDPAKKAALLAMLKTLQADATFFAAEAYHSEGPLKHVVKAGQSSKIAIEGNGITYPTEKAKNEAIAALKAAELAKMSANQMLQSFNENLGDMLKDLRHYASEPFPGVGFFRSSKYLERLCEAFGLITGKLPERAQAGFAAIKIGGKAPDAVRGEVGGLVAIRGDKKGFKADGDGAVPDPEAEKQAYAIAEMSKIFPSVVTLPDLGKVVSAFGQQVNALARNAIAEQMKAASDAAYFQAAPPPVRPS